MAEPPLTRGEMLKIFLERAERLKRQEEIARLNPAATALRIALADFKVQFREHLDRRMRVELSVSDDGPSGSVPASYSEDAVCPTVGEPTPEVSPADSPVQPAHDNADRHGEVGEEQPVGGALAVDHGVGQFNGAQAAMTKEGCMEQLADLRKRMGEERYADLLFEQRKLTHPTYVDLKSITESAIFPQLLKFFTIASGSAAKPKKSYQELGKIILEVGLVPERVLSEVTEELWITPSPKNTGNPGNNRHHLAWTIFLSMLKYLSQVCCYGTKCPGLVRFDMLTAFSLTGVEYDHKDPKIKTKIMRDKFEGIGCKWPWSELAKKRAEAAIKELGECQVICSGCHDRGEGRRRVDTAKRGPPATRLN